VSEASFAGEKGQDGIRERVGWRINEYGWSYIGRSRYASEFIRPFDVSAPFLCSPATYHRCQRVADEERRGICNGRLIHGISSDLKHLARIKRKWCTIQTRLFGLRQASRLDKATTREPGQSLSQTSRLHFIALQLIPMLMIAHNVVADFHRPNPIRDFIDRIIMLPSRHFRQIFCSRRSGRLPSVTLTGSPPPCVGEIFW